MLISLIMKQEDISNTKGLGCMMIMLVKTTKKEMMAIALNRSSSLPLPLLRSKGTLSMRSYSP